MKTILIMALKDLRLLVRDKPAFFFTFFFPVVYAIFFGAIFSGGGGPSQGMPVLVVDEDQSRESRSFTQLLQAAPELNLGTADRETAREAVRKGNRVAFIALPKGFGEARSNIFFGPPPRVELGADPRRQAEAGMLQGVLTKYASEIFQEVLGNPDSVKEQMSQARAQASGAPAMVQESLTRMFQELETLSLASGADDGSPGFSGLQPLKIDPVEVTLQRSGPPNAYAISFPQGIIWAILGCSAGFGISLVLERQRGTLMRLRSAPVGQFQILAGKAIACFFTIVVVSGLLLLLARLVFDVRPQSPGLLAMGLVAAGLGFVGIMMLIAVLGKSEQAAGGIGWAILLIMAMLGGGMVPLFVMPAWMQTLSHVSPVKWSILAMEGAVWRQFSFAEMLLPCSILLAVGVICFGIGVKAFDWSSEA